MEWIAIDLPGGRSWRMSGLEVLDRRTGTEPAALVGDWTGPQIIAGLVDDAGPRQTPCPVFPDQGLFPPITQAQPHHILPHAAAIAGYLHCRDWDGVICHVTDRVYWVQVSANEIISFQASVAPTLAAGLGGTGSEADFDAGLDQGLDRPEWLLPRMASALDTGKPAAFLRGLIIGTDLKAARPYWLGQQVAVIGEGDLAQGYARGLAAQGCPVTAIPDTTLAGLCALYYRLSESKNAF